MHNIQEHLANVIRDARESRKFTQEQLAGMSGIETRTLSSIESGKGNPEFKTLYSVITCLEISADTIFYPKADRQNVSLQKILMALDKYEEQELDEISPILVSIINDMINLIRKHNNQNIL